MKKGTALKILGKKSYELLFLHALNVLAAFQVQEQKDQLNVTITADIDTM